VYLDVCCSGTTLEVEISDDGCGFDASLHFPGAGLASLRSRARRLSARLSIDTAPGRGTRLRLDVPVVSAAVEQTTPA
jgi:signal transduction histidine kinase